MEDRYDIIIVGSGPAGLSAAVNASIRNKKILLFGIKELSNKLIKAPKINNYLGFYNITGEKLKEHFKEHIESMNIKVTYEKVNQIYAMGDYFSISCGNNMYECKSVILATGMEYTKPIKGEEKYIGKGVGSCATCDAPLYRGKTAVIIGYNKEAEKDADFLCEIASKVYYIPMYREPCNVNSKVEIVQDTPLEIKGNDMVQMLILRSRQINTDGVFIMKDSVPPSELMPGLKMQDGHITVDRNMKTNIDGCYACGDCTGKPYQYMKSAGEGQVAALNVVDYLADKIK